MVSGQQSRSTLSEINVTPLVDVMLVLLIIFMITAPMLQQGLEVNLPVATGTAQPTTEDEIIVTITKDGTIYLNQTAYTLAQLSAKLPALAKNRPNQPYFLRADATVPYGIVVQVMDAVKQAGIDKLGMITQPVVEQP